MFSRFSTVDAKAGSLAASDSTRRRQTSTRRSGPALTALYRRWLEGGDEVVSLARSPAHRDALERGQGEVECVVLSHRYGYLSSLAGTS